MHGLQLDREPFGTMPDDTLVDRYTFGRRRGLLVRMLTYGATLQTVELPDRRGERANVTLGLATLDDYRTKSPYFGATIGRYANRIAGGKFTIDGHEYQVPVNDGPNALHGGPEASTRGCGTRRRSTTASASASGSVTSALTVRWGSRASSPHPSRTQ